MNKLDNLAVGNWMEKELDNLDKYLTISLEYGKMMEISKESLLNIYYQMVYIKVSKFTVLAVKSYRNWPKSSMMKERKNSD